MSYLGKVDMNDANIKHYSLTGSTLTTVNIGWTPASEQSLRVTINGVVQQGDTFSYSGANLTLGGPLIVTDTLEVVGIESVGRILVPADDAVTTVKINDDAVTLDKMAGGTDGNLITYDASGDPAHVATGSATHVLTSNGAGAAPTFQAAATSTPGLVKLASTEVTTGVAAVIFDSGVVTAYDNYLIIVNGIKTAASAANGTISFSTDNGSTFIAKIKFSAHVIDMDAGSDGGIHTGSFTSDSVSVPVYFDNHDTQPMNGHWYFFNCNPETDATASVQCNYTASYTNQAGTKYNLFGAAMYDVTAGQQINYFKMLIQSWLHKI